MQASPHNESWLPEPLDGGMTAIPGYSGVFRYASQAKSRACEDECEAFDDDLRCEDSQTPVLFAQVAAAESRPAFRPAESSPGLCERRSRGDWLGYTMRQMHAH